jgi:hypothetical protein
MIRANGKRGKVDLIADGKVIASLQDNKFSFELGERTFTIKREGHLLPTYQLWSGDNVIVSAKQVPLLKRYSVTYAGQEWTLKAIGFMEKKFRLYRNGEQVGSVTPTHPFLNPYKEVVIDLPNELPLEAQAFLMWRIMGLWGETGD